MRIVWESVWNVEMHETKWASINFSILIQSFEIFIQAEILHWFLNNLFFEERIAHNEATD
jgi:hypothetical protein